MLLEIVLTVVILVGILFFVGMPLESILNLLVVVIGAGVLLTVAFVVLFFLGTDIYLLFFRKVGAVSGGPSGVEVVFPEGRGVFRGTFRERGHFSGRSANGLANGSANGLANGLANGSAKRTALWPGWIPL